MAVREYDISVIREGDIITLEHVESGSVLKDREVGLGLLSGSLLFAIAPGAGGIYLTSLIEHGWVITGRKVKAPRNPGYYQSYTGRSVYLRTRQGRWFEMSRFGKVTEFSDADLEERPHLFPFKKIGDIVSE